MQTLYIIGEATRAVFTHTDAVLLLGVLVAAAFIDIRTYRIPNALTVPAMVAGVLVHVFANGATWSVVGSALAGVVTPIVVLVPLHAMRLLGAGDIKLIAVVGAFLGAPAILLALLFVLAAGGVVAVAFAVWRKVLLRAVANIAVVTALAATGGVAQGRVLGASRGSAGRIPYAVSIVLGTTSFLVLREMLS